MALLLKCIKKLKPKKDDAPTLDLQPTTTRVTTVPSVTVITISGPKKVPNLQVTVTPAVPPKDSFVKPSLEVPGPSTKPEPVKSFLEVSGKKPEPKVEVHPQPISTIKKLLGYRKRHVAVTKDDITVHCGNDEGEKEMESNTSMASGASTVSIRAAMVEQLEYKYDTERDLVVNKDGFISTPLHIVKTFALESKEPIHTEHCMIEHRPTKKKLYRVEILLGAIRGVGQCSRWQFARQLAAMDVLDKLAESEEFTTSSKLKDTNYALLAGWRVDASVYSLLHQVVTQQGLPEPTFTSVAPKHQLGKCTVTCRVGDFVTEAESDLPYLAKKLTVKAMIEQITNEEVPLISTSYGTDCLTITDIKKMGFKPKTSAIKRKWLMENRIQDTQLVYLSDEPDDGDMDDLEEEVRQNEAKKIKLGGMKATLQVTVRNDKFDTGSSAREFQSASSSSMKRPRSRSRPPKIPSTIQEEAGDADCDEEEYQLIIDVDPEDVIFKEFTQ